MLYSDSVESRILLIFMGASKGSFWLLEGFFYCSPLFAVEEFFDDVLNPVDPLHFLSLVATLTPLSQLSQRFLCCSFPRTSR